ncbi:hypothetical protein F5X99DRAFT_404113 [Biscogniauxia marginata]|nr:hypothetical protein F5X99DRAFT_404113 [Biscogniauxia marginata]
MGVLALRDIDDNAGELHPIWNVIAALRHNDTYNRACHAALIVVFTPIIVCATRKFSIRLGRSEQKLATYFFDQDENYYSEEDDDEPPPSRAL